MFISPPDALPPVDMLLLTAPPAPPPAVNVVKPDNTKVESPPAFPAEFPDTPAPPAPIVTVAVALEDAPENHLITLPPAAPELAFVVEEVVIPPDPPPPIIVTLNLPDDGTVKVPDDVKTTADENPLEAAAQLGADDPLLVST